jgi:hypothetical protein
MPYRIFSVILLIATGLLCSSCSWVTRFVVVNKSSDALEIRYTLVPLSGVQKLQKTTLDDKGKLKTDTWQEVSPEQYEYDRETETVTLRLAPNEALEIASEITYTGHHSTDNNFFKIKTLNLSGTRGAARYEGRQALTQFKEESESLYTIIYE